MDVFRSIGESMKHAKYSNLYTNGIGHHAEVTEIAKEWKKLRNSDGSEYTRYAWVVRCSADNIRGGRTRTFTFPREQFLRDVQVGDRVWILVDTYRYQGLLTRQYYGNYKDVALPYSAYFKKNGLIKFPISITKPQYIHHD